MTNGIEIFGKLFGGLNKAKIMRFFILNPEIQASSNEIESVVKVEGRSLRKELANLTSLKLLDERMASRSNAKGDGKIRVRTWQLDGTFPFITDLRRILSYDIVEERMDVARKFRGCGRIKLVVLSGIFMSDSSGRVDLAVVGEELDRRGIDRAVHKLEAEIGKELNYTIMDTDDFNFRMFSGDKFIRDIMDYPHEFALNKLNL
ncbi:MAG: hypothetical protein NTY66_01180 [Candidatus Vogelbacteria bacterium]|nr:hypothetical protein [Candidatus Vogelbacteria bacterium]